MPMICHRTIWIEMKISFPAFIFLSFSDSIRIVKLSYNSFEMSFIVYSCTRWACIISSFYLRCKLHDVTVCCVFISCFSFMEIVVVCICAALSIELKIFCIKKRLQWANYNHKERETRMMGTEEKCSRQIEIG